MAAAPPPLPPPPPTKERDHRAPMHWAAKLGWTALFSGPVIIAAGLVLDAWPNLEAQIRAVAASADVPRLLSGAGIALMLLPVLAGLCAAWITLIADIWSRPKWRRS